MCFHSDLSGVASIFGHYAKLADTPYLGIPVFSRVRKLAKSANQLHHFCQSVLMYQFGSHWTNFREM